MVPLLDKNHKIFRRSFLLNVDYQLLSDVELFGDSPVEELTLFVNKHLYTGTCMKAVVSLLNPRYSGTAFRVSPNGTLITSKINLPLTSNRAAADKELYIHSSVASSSFYYAGSEVEKICAVPCMNETLDIALFTSLPKNEFLIPCCIDLDQAKSKSNATAVVVIGFPRNINTDNIVKYANGCSEYQKKVVPLPSNDEYTFGHLSVCPGALVECDSTFLYCSAATTPGFAGSPVCLMDNPRMFIGIHGSAGHSMEYTRSMSVMDSRFYELYSNSVVPHLRNCKLCAEDIDAINRYLAIGITPRLVHQVQT